jgi:hypothetical protein
MTGRVRGISQIAKRTGYFADSSIRIINLNTATTESKNFKQFTPPPAP